MLYHSWDSLRDFDFHDAKIFRAKLSENTFSFKAKHVNHRPHSNMNEYDRDMEILEAEISFEGFHLLEFEPGREWRMDENNEPYALTPLVLHTDEEAMNMLRKELEDDLIIYYLDQDDSGQYSMDADGASQFFTLRFTFDRVCISWDSYRGLAWYELHRVFPGSVHLTTSEGIKTASCRVICHDEEMAHNGQTEPPPSVNIVLTHSDQEYYASNSSPNWKDAFDKLEKALPTHTSIQCCAACRFSEQSSNPATPNIFLCQKKAFEEKKHNNFCEYFQK